MATRRKNRLTSQQNSDITGAETPARRLNFKDFDIESFNPEAEEWEYWYYRFTFAINACEFDDENDKKNHLLAKVSAKPFRTLVDHFYPEKLENLSFDELITVLNKNYGRKDISLCERLKFTKLARSDSEPVTEYVARLRTQATRCEFGNTLMERLRDQLIFGINEKSWQQEILRKYPSTKSSLEEIETFAQILENARIQQDSMHQEIQHSRTHRIMDTNLANKDRNPSSRKIVLIRNKHCFRCGGLRHSVKEACPAMGAKCTFCKGADHFTKVCFKAGNVQVKKEDTRNVKQETENNSDSELENDTADFIRKVERGSEAFVNIKLNGVLVEMLFDSGASKSVIGKSIWKKIGSPTLTKTANLVAYTGFKIKTIGSTTIRVEGFKRSKNLPVIVTEANDTPLLGMNWILALDVPLPPGTKIRQIGLKTPTVEKETFLAPLFRKYADVFAEGHGTIKNHKAVIHMKPNAEPKIFRARRVPFAIKESVEAELDRLVSSGILEEVDPTITPIEWASPLVIATKSNGKIRICGDFKVTINPWIHMDYHPIPCFEDLITKLQGGQEFTVIDLRDAYLQMEVEESCRKFLTIATHRGFYQYRRLPFGVCFAPGLFQRTVEQVLAGIPGVANYLDDIIITGENREQHLSRLNLVLQRLQSTGMRTQLEKCKWFETEINYLGHLLDSNGIRPTKEHLKAISLMPDPTSAKELRAFLGSVNYYSKFVPNLQTLCSPLHELLKKGVKWQWTPIQSDVVKQVKEMLLSSTALAHYDPYKPVVLSTDASDVGVGAVLFQKGLDGMEKPISYASRTLNPPEKKYSALDKEALAIMFGLAKFKQYLYGRHFTIRTDHRPLIHLLGENKEIPKLAANRLTRWALTLSAFDYTIEYLSGKKNVPADTLSRLPMPTTEVSYEEEDGARFGNRLLNIRLEDICISKSVLQKNTLQDPILRDVLRFAQDGWPQDKSTLTTDLHTYFEKRMELSYEEKILIWQGRIVIPKTIRPAVLDILHEGHPGITGMRAVARCHVWWPNLDRDIELHVKTCKPCQQNRPREQQVPLYSWSIPQEAWSRVHIDFCGPFLNQFWLIVIDAYSKWLEVFPMDKITSLKTINILRDLFTRFGLPHTLVSDNGPQFTSTEFKSFCRDNNITHITSAPYHPKTNGLAEREVRTFKERMKSLSSIKDTKIRLQRFLLSYRITPQKTTGRSPAELFFGRQIKTRLDLLKPNINLRMDNQLVLQKCHHDRKTRTREFVEGEDVWVEDPLKHIFVEGVVKRKTGTFSYLVEVAGTVKRKHADQMKTRQPTNESST